MITFMARVKALPGKEKEAAARLTDMVNSVKSLEPGALAYVCHSVPGKQGEFLFYEAYADEATKDAHMKTPHFEKLKGLFATLLDPSFGAEITDLNPVAGFFRS